MSPISPIVCISVFLTLVTSSLVSAQANVTGNCVSGNYSFTQANTQSRVFLVPQGQDIADLKLNPNLYDFSVDYNTKNAVFNAATNSMDLLLSKGTLPQGDGVRVSHTRYVFYGKMTARIRTSTAKGVVTAFITMSREGAKRNPIGITEYTHSQTHTFVSNANGYNDFTIDWNRQRIITTTYNSSFQATVTAPTVRPLNAYWYPVTPSLVQFSVWDAGNSPSAGTSEWAGGPTNLTVPQSASFSWLSIQCYDSADRLVTEWPVGSKGAAVIQPTVAAIVAPVTLPKTALVGDVATVPVVAASGTIVPIVAINENISSGANSLLINWKGALVTFIVVFLLQV
ncbi:hypothetical protein HK096_003963 [Nowakowskiella sp. JEL0078]|nr:hypothetical protein HK096_003963 [Nowakowskiella sp. JEL0078]